MALSSNCWKYLVLTFNVLFAMSALVLFGASGFLLYKLFIYRHFIGINVEYPAILLLMMSIITCSIAWIGWRTARSMHQIHVIMAGILIVLVVVIEFSCFVWAMVVWDNIEIDIKTTMTTYFEETHGNSEQTVDTVRWDRLHVKFQCCGVSGPGDFSSSGHVPFSCCGQGPLDSLHKPYTADCSTLFQRGCGNPLHEYAKEQLILVAMTALAASILQGPLDSLHKPYTADCSTLFQRGCGNPLHEYAKEQLILVAMTALAASILQGPLDSLHKPYTADCSTLFQRGCGNPLHEYAKEQLILVAMTALAASILQSTGIFCTFFLAHAIRERRRASIRNSASVREATFAAPDDSLLSPSAPAPTLPKY